MFKLFFLVFYLGFASSAVYNYCNQDLCKLTSYKHITCTATGDFSPSCSADASEVSLTDSDKQKILKLHNKHRNKIASGNEPGFNPATKMLTVEWDDELAEYASLNVRRCKFEHDCHNTPQMKYSGQNIYYSARTDAFEKNIGNFIDDAFQSWWDERKLASQENIDSCCGPPMEIPHFLEVSSDRVNRVGCAISQYTSSQGKETLMTCNYSFQIITGQKVYVSGEPASECKTGSNPNYTALCSTDEEFDPNNPF
ncbi:hypothetical protein PVAND_015648 [Polypedilum vanderplanki]|uniref:SCP domain-containing protein n=1 Tax=Polypedilum vanderplanki TaxID=319348 RepID=A0A9J6BCW0_POLVA|nr:hypothetical protein PVAND_015648 [Polypedilum vanderplanki]